MTGDCVLLDIYVEQFGVVDRLLRPSIEYKSSLFKWYSVSLEGM